MSSAIECKAQLLAAQEAHLAKEWAKQKECLWWEEEEFACQMAELESKEEEEWKACKEEEQKAWEAKEQRLWEEEEQRVQKEEEKELRLASEREKRWLAEEKAEGSLKSGGMRMGFAGSVRYGRNHANNPGECLFLS